MAELSISRKQREFVAQRAKYRCEYCHSPLDFCPDPFCIEHIIPLAGGGANDMDNLAFSCQGCNSYKYTSVTALDPVTGEAVTLYNPRKDGWEEHFTWSEDCLLLTGISAKGRATIERLYLNRTGVVNLRRVLHKVGEHP
ncbi:MAG: HNH endonuclease [Caldilineaceae bacterium]|jgi:hypothetical protein